VTQRRSLEVWKFGGASLADAEGFRRAVRLIRAHDGPLVVVVSALYKLTDQLLDGARHASEGDAAAGSRAAALLLRRHRRLAHELVAPGRARTRLLAEMDQQAREYRELTRAVAALGELSPRVSDAMVARGERLSAGLMAAAISRAGARATAEDALELIATDGHFGNATPDVALSRHRSRRRLRALLERGVVPVIPGFQGTGPDGVLRTLGRGGTDLTATLMARVLSAARVVLWKDVPGILTADPRSVEDARLIPELHHREAAEVAYFGAKVLHPRALIPLDGSRIVVDVRSFLHPDRPGTVISSRPADPGHPVKAIATVKGQALVTVTGKGMMGVPGIAARTFAAVQAAGLSVSTIFQASSESSIGFTLPESDARTAQAALHAAFKEEIAAGLVDDVTRRGDVAVMAVVGNGMVGTRGIAARLFSALAAGGVNVVAIAQGSSERNISFVVDAEAASEAERRIHAAFQLAKIGGGRATPWGGTDVVLLGFGHVGQALAEHIAAHGTASRLRAIGLIDSSGYVFEPNGLSRRRLLSLVAGKRRGASLVHQKGVAGDAAAALEYIASHAVSRPILVDVTAHETGDVVAGALAQGFDLVLANKIPLASSAASYRQLFSRAKESGRRIRFEATVGAGLPILDTYRKLVESGDRVRRVEGCMSGTLGYLLSAVGDGRPFSEAVREAMELGYSEPDPREDLSGRDAARKGLILARLLGYRGPVPSAENLVPPALRKLPLEEFVERLPALDAQWRARAEQAAARGRALRYVVVATKSGVTAGLVAAPVSGPIGSLRGTRNLVAFTTRRYRREPLVIMGPGAGVELTASVVLNDLRDLAASWGLGLELHGHD
jgi:aspartokinase/homoserine dehydrogenase 1